MHQNMQQQQQEQDDNATTTTNTNNNGNEEEFRPMLPSITEGEEQCLLLHHHSQQPRHYHELSSLTADSGDQGGDYYQSTNENSSHGHYSYQTSCQEQQQEEEEEEEENGGHHHHNNNSNDNSNNKNNQQDDKEDDKDDDDDEDEDEGVPSLTAAFQSVENRSILRLCAMYLAIYFATAVLAFSFIFEQWTIIDSLYFAVATFTTCGYGDLEPTTIAGQIFTIFFAVYGIIILGVFIGIVGNFMSEHQFHATLDSQEEYGDQVLEALFTGIDEKDDKPATLPLGSNNNNNNNNYHKVPKRYTYKEARDDFLGDQISLVDDFVYVCKAEAKPIGLVAIGGLILGIREGWNITSICYFCIMAASTTGYGDYTPKTQTDKLFCVFFYPLAVCVFGEVLARIAGVYMQRRRKAAEKKFLHQALTLCDLRKMDADKDGTVTKEEFMCFMLVALQQVEQELVDDLREIFDKFDTTGSGTLDKRDLVNLTKKNYKPLKKINEELSQEIREELTSMTEWPSLFTTRSRESNNNNNNNASETGSSTAESKHRRFHTII